MGASGCRPLIFMLLCAALCISSSLAVGTGREATNTKIIEESGDPYTIYEGKYVVEVSACDQKAVNITMAAIEPTDCEFLSEESILELQADGGCGKEWVICSAKDGEMLVFEYGAEIKSKDAGTYFRESGGNVQAWDFDANRVQSGGIQTEFYTAYRDLAARERRVKEIVDNSNGIAKLEALSPTTHEGRTIWAIRIRDKQWKPGRPRVIYTYQQHAREWVAGMTGIYTAEFLINALKVEPDFIQGMEIVIVPMCNPDGFQYSTTSARLWRKNRRKNGGSCDGVDLNRNWGKDWGGRESTSRNQCQDTYIGPSSMSEPETKALASLIAEAEVHVFIDIHCFSELILGPWSYTRTRHPDKPKYDALGLAMQKAIKEAHGKTYKYGTGGEVIYLASGVFPDWVGERWPKSAGYCYELRPSGNAGRNGFAPPASQILPSSEEAIQGLYTAIDWAKDQGAPLPPPIKPPTPTKPPEDRRRRGPRPARRRSPRRRSGKSRRRRRRADRRRRRSRPTPRPEPTRRRRRGDRRRTWPRPTPKPTPRPEPRRRRTRRRTRRSPPPRRRRAPPSAASWRCSVCSHKYNAAEDGGGKPFEELPSSWRCPVCGQPKSAYRKER